MRKRERTRYKGGKGRAGYHPHPLAQQQEKEGAFTNNQERSHRHQQSRPKRGKAPTHLKASKHPEN